MTNSLRLVRCLVGFYFSFLFPFPLKKSLGSVGRSVVCFWVWTPLPMPVGAYMVVCVCVLYMSFEVMCASCNNLLFSLSLDEARRTTGGLVLVHTSHHLLSHPLSSLILFRPTDLLFCRIAHLKRRRSKLCGLCVLRASCCALFTLHIIEMIILLLSPFFILLLLAVVVAVKHWWWWWWPPPPAAQLSMIVLFSFSSQNWKKQMPRVSFKFFLKKKNERNSDPPKTTRRGKTKGNGKYFFFVDYGRRLRWWSVVCRLELKNSRIYDFVQCRPVDSQWTN